jgi:hypothetical protein
MHGGRRSQEPKTLQSTGQPAGLPTRRCCIPQTQDLPRANQPQAACAVHRTLHGSQRAGTPGYPQTLGRPNAQEIEVHIDKLRKCFTRFIGPPEEDAPHRGPGRPRRNCRRRSRSPSPELGGPPQRGGGDDHGEASEGEDPPNQPPVGGERERR